VITVVAAVVEEDGRFLVTRRLKGTHLAGFWEFPGGKVDDGETHEEALQRELLEELNVGLRDLKHVFTTTHAYPERTVQLHFFRAALTGVPQPALGQDVRWVSRDDFAALEFPAADTELLDHLAHSRL